ncbi:glucan biosynthesis protein [Paracoccus aerodenitrificans]|uniref:glucan biosynthesis protein n=1 Tax=Paracoccus aerodenitrificans TaxID=3017781 RepID=UPI0022F114B3|nr:glucan biosynthesis protein [Paracoccus aerodenitrificans]WBU63021.1 glucan biosynthesis protein [Paracoccus aerodenitrificans]
MKRRNFIGTMTAAAALGTASRGFAQNSPDAAEGETSSESSAPFGFESVASIAAGVASREWESPARKLSGPFADIDYDAYRAIRFRRDADPWKDIPGFGLDLLSPGMIFYEPVRINMVNEGIPQPMPFDPSVFDFDPAFFPADAADATPDEMGWSGFRIRNALNKPDILDELAVFQGASYFRVLGRGNRYGLSARGLAIRTGSAEGEEFPVFREYWIHQPNQETGSVTIQALLDSRSVAGAYEFVITPGTDSLVKTRVALFPRTDLDRVGIAPLTSMFWFGPADGGIFDDYRPAVHDSDGLQMITGSGQRLWRVLSNPAKLQISAFVDQDPRGFGLIQRPRDFVDYEDAEANYELRPSAWIEPKGDWGRGTVSLIEIPVDSEFHDNIVSFWQPSDPLEAGTRSDFAYTLGFGDRVVPEATLARVASTRSGLSVNRPGVSGFVIDFDLAPFTGRDDPAAVVNAARGKIENAYLLRLPEQGLMRLSFEYLPEGAEVADLSAVLEGSEGMNLSETWLYRWSEG